MRCQDTQESIVLAQYGELPDELLLPLEQHLNTCDECRREWNAQLALHETLELDPVLEPTPNLLAASRMRLDEALDAIPPSSVAHRFAANAYRWLGFVTGAPALATLLLGVGFLGGNTLTRFQVSHAPIKPTPVVISRPGQGDVASVSGIRQTPNSDLVQVDYNRVIPETVQGSMNSPEIRNLLLLGTKLAANKEAREAAVTMVADECRTGHACSSGENAEADNGSGELRLALVNSLRFDKSSTVRLQALNGLQPYVAEDIHVRDAVLEALMHDRNEAVRTEAISMLSPVGADSSVRQALRTASTEDINPAVRNASFQVLQHASDIE